MVQRMIHGLPRSRASRPGRLVSLLLLVLAVTATASSGLDWLVGLRCGQHGVGRAHGSDHLTAQETAATRTQSAEASPAWRATRVPDCAHCPAAECARLTTCAGATTIALSPASMDVAGLTGDRVPLEVLAEQAFSATSPPDTPPPQLIA
jgi:hypothetical protein